MDEQIDVAGLMILLVFVRYVYFQSYQKDPIHQVMKYLIFWGDFYHKIKYHGKTAWIYALMVRRQWYNTMLELLLKLRIRKRNVAAAIVFFTETRLPKIMPPELMTVLNNA